MQSRLPFHDVVALGQVFTPAAVVDAMLALRRRQGRVLEPACGDGAFLDRLPGAVGIEIDPAHCPPGARCMDFFALPEHERFDTIIGNPPYVRFQDIPQATRVLLETAHFDGRSNLYLFFIEKCLRHLAPGGELIFITPRDFLKVTSAVRLNRLLWESGSITDAIELGDARVFDGSVPNCIIWRFEKGRTDRGMRLAVLGQGDDLDVGLTAPGWQARTLLERAGHLMFVRGEHPLRLADIAFVKVGAVSGADELYVDEHHGNREFVYAATVRNGRTRRMIWCEPDDPPPAVLEPHRARLLARRIRRFGDHDWWQWGRSYYRSERPRIYVNGRTRSPRPFFVHPCPHYDGSVLAVFPHGAGVDCVDLAAALNDVDWGELGFVCDGRYLFTQRSLENAPLPASFARFVDGVGGASDAPAQLPGGAADLV